MITGSSALGGASDNAIWVGNGAADSVTMGGPFFVSHNKVTLGNGDDDVVNTSRNSGGNTMTLGNGDGDVVNNSGTGDAITLGNGSDMVTAGANNIITVGNGADSVTAGPGSTITLGNGTDTVMAVSSLIHAGRGHDTFVFTDSFGQNTITNFSPAHDNIVLAQAMFANFGAVQSDMTQVGANTVIAYSASNSITLTNVNASRACTPAISSSSDAGRARSPVSLPAKRPPTGLLTKRPPYRAIRPARLRPLPAAPGSKRPKRYPRPVRPKCRRAAALRLRAALQGAAKVPARVRHRIQPAKCRLRFVSFDAYLAEGWGAADCFDVFWTRRANWKFL